MAHSHDNANYCRCNCACRTCQVSVPNRTCDVSTRLSHEVAYERLEIHSSHRCTDDCVTGNKQVASEMATSLYNGQRNRAIQNEAAKTGE